MHASCWLPPRQNMQIIKTEIKRHFNNVYQKGANTHVKLNAMFKTNHNAEYSVCRLTCNERCI